MFRTELLCEWDSAWVVVRVEGEVDLSTAAELDAALARARTIAARAVICDLSGVTFFALAGFHCLQRIEDELRTADVGFHLVVGAAAATMPVLARLLPSYRWNVHDDVAAATGTVRQGAG